MSDHRLDISARALSFPVAEFVPMPECETAVPAGNDEPSFDELTFDPLTEEYA